MGEQWKPFPADDRYEVSDLGRVRRASTGRVRRPVALKNGYLTVMVSNGSTDRKLYYIHRMVYETFVGPIPLGMQVRHGPNGQTDNRLSELRMGTVRENIADKKRDGTEPTGAARWSAKLTDPEVESLRSRRGEPYRLLAAEFGVSTTTIGRVVRGESYPAEAVAA
ncbi:NUMOD4 domain-containing protein [Nocardia rhizosphaerae]|uniref:NUMOD4 domain-containing protein n=1 Tax=Nocardia rhizosphaerae TaxID=1691571 RepID=A0ABV8LFF6_9NOCA